MTAYQACCRCVMDTSDPDIVFSPSGECNYCTERLKTLKYFCDTFGEADTTRIIAEIKRAGRGKDYDAIAGVSGGFDSAYLACIMKDLGVRLLLVHLDNGWDTSGAVTNIAALCDALGCDYESHVLDWEEFRRIQLAFLKASVVEAETPFDVAIPPVLYHTAAKHGVRYVLLANNPATEGILPPRWHYNPRDLRYFKAICHRFGAGKLRTFPLFGIIQELWFKYFHGIKMVYPLCFNQFDKGAALEIVQSRMKWQPQGGKHHESLYTKFVQAYLLPTKFGFDYRRVTLSSMICAQQITRQDALMALESPPLGTIEALKLKSYVAKKLCISRHELDEIVALPPRFHTDYPNNERWLKLVYAAYNWLRGRVT